MDYTNIIQDVLYTLVTGLLPLLAIYLVKLLRVKLTEQIQKVDNDYAKNTLLEVSDIVEKAILDTSNNFTNKLKEHGKWDSEKAKEALNMTLDIVKTQLTEDTRNLIVAKYSDLETYLKSLITATYETNKANEYK